MKVSVNLLFLAGSLSACGSSHGQPPKERGIHHDPLVKATVTPGVQTPALSDNKIPDPGVKVSTPSAQTAQTAENTQMAATQALPLTFDACDNVLDDSLAARLTDEPTAFRDLANLRFLALPAEKAWPIYQNAQKYKIDAHHSPNMTHVLAHTAETMKVKLDSLETFARALNEAKNGMMSVISGKEFRMIRNVYNTLFSEPTAWRECLTQPSPEPQFHLALARKDQTTVTAKLYLVPAQTSTFIPTLKVSFLDGTVKTGEKDIIETGNRYREFTVNISENIPDFKVNLETESGNFSKSLIAEGIPLTPASFELARCHLQNAIMMQSGLTPRLIIETLDPFLVIMHPTNDYQTSCEFYLSTYK